MSAITDHMAAWGVPPAYRDDYPRRSCFEFRGSIDRVARTANWHPEQTRALEAMATAGDWAAIQSWDREMLVLAGTEIGDGDSGEEYADSVMEALEILAAEVRAAERSER